MKSAPRQMALFFRWVPVLPLGKYWICIRFGERESQDFVYLGTRFKNPIFDLFETCLSPVSLTTVWLAGYVRQMLTWFLVPGRQFLPGE